MSIADKLTTIAQNEQRVYDAGKADENRAYWEHFWEANRNSDRSKYILRSAFSGGGWNDETFSRIIYPEGKIMVYGVSAQNMMYYFNRTYNYDRPLIDLTEFCKHVDLSGITNGTYLFANARAKNITVDLGKCTNLQYGFSGDNGGELENIKVKVTKVCTNFAGCFNYQYTLKEIRFTEDSEIATSVSFAQSNCLTDASIDSIIDALGTVSTTQTLTVHSSVYSRMAEDGKDALVTAKNWTLVKA